MQSLFNEFELDYEVPAEADERCFKLREKIRKGIETQKKKDIRKQERID